MSNPSGTPAASAHPLPSYLQADHLGPWGNYLQQVDRVTPYLGSLARWVETLKRPKRILIVDVPIERECNVYPMVPPGAANRDMLIAGEPHADAAA